MRPRVYKLNQKKLADEIKINLVFIPLDRYYSDMAMGGQFGRETYVDVASLPDSVILRLTEFVVQKSEDGRPISRDFAGTFYQKLDNVVLTQDKETGHLELVSSRLEDINGSFEEISIPQDQKPEADSDDEAEATEVPEEEEEAEDEPSTSFKDAIDEAMNSDEDIHTMDVPDAEEEQEEESFEEEEEDPDEYDGTESGEETHDPSIDEAMDESEEDDDDIDPFSQEYFEENKKAKEKTEENRKELANQINEQQSKLVSANKRQLPKPNRLVPRENVQKPNRDNNQQQRRQNNNNRPPQNGKKKFQPNRDNNRDVKIVKAPGIFDDPLRAELFNKLKED